MDVTIIIVSYKTRELTLACLHSVFEQSSGIEFEVIVVDNQSEDGSAEAIADEFPRLNLIRPDENLGFARANNLAAEQATGRYLLLLNPDTVVLDGAVQTLHTFARENPDAGIFGGRTLFPDGSLNPTSCWGRPTPWSAFCRGSGLAALFKRSRLFDSESLGRWQRDTVREVDIVTGCLLMIRRDLWNELHGFDPAFHMYGEDADLCLRLRKHGGNCLICPDARIIHHGGASEKVRADKIVRLFRARAQLYHRHWSPPAARFGVLMLDAWAFSRSSLSSVARGKWIGGSDAPNMWRKVWERRDAWRSPRRCIVD